MLRLLRRKMWWMFYIQSPIPCHLFAHGFRRLQNSLMYAMFHLTSAICMYVWPRSLSEAGNKKWMFSRKSCGLELLWLTCFLMFTVKSRLYKITFIGERFLTRLLCNYTGETVKFSDKKNIYMSVFIIQLAYLWCIYKQIGLHVWLEDYTKRWYVEVNLWRYCKI